MAEPLTALPLTFENGLFSALEDTVTPPGFATVLRNWVHTPAGGLRVRPGWTTTHTGIGTRHVYGIWWHSNIGLNGLPVVVNRETGTYTFYVLGWTTPGLLEPIGTNPASFSGGTVTATMGKARLTYGGTLLAVIHGIKADGTFDSSVGIVSPKNIRAIQFHKDSFWAGGGNDDAGDPHPETLYWTDPGDDPLNVDWPMTENFLDVHVNGGEAIEGLAEWHDILFVAKTESSWVVTGAPPDITLRRIEGGEAAVGKCLIPTPQGLFIIGKRGVYVFDGAQIRSISDALADLYNAESSDPEYPGVCGAEFNGELFINAGDDTWVYHIGTQTWRREVLLNQQVPNLSYGPTLYAATNDFGLLERTQFDYASDAVDQTYRIRTPEMRPDTQVRDPIFRHLDLVLRQRGGNVAGVKMQLDTRIRRADGTWDVTTDYIQPDTPGVYRKRIDLPGLGQTIQFTLEHTVPGGSDAIFDIEKATLYYQPGD